MATQARPASRLRIGGAQRVKVHDENAVKGKLPVAAPTVGGAKRIPLPSKQMNIRAALGEITAKVNGSKNIQSNSGSNPGDGIAKAKRGRSASVTVTSTSNAGPQRVNITQSNRASLQVQVPAERPNRHSFLASARNSLKVPETVIQAVEVADEEDPAFDVAPPPPTSDAMDIEEHDELDNEVDQLVEEEEQVANLVHQQPEIKQAELILPVEETALPVVEEVVGWPHLSPAKKSEYDAQFEKIKKTFVDEVDPFDTAMVSEYSEEILDYMGQLEISTMPTPNYMASQTEITWEMREKLVDWMCQAHLRYHMLPETLWIAVNIVDRFLSLRAVSLIKLQLVGVTALFIAAKYEEIMAPTVDEFIFITEKTFTRDEIMKGERIILQTLQFRVSNYCSPYTWVRRISKADDYDLQTRTLSKFLMEVTLLDHRFLQAKPSLIAAIGMYSSRIMLGGTWNDAFVFYSGFSEDYLIPGHNILVEKLVDEQFTQQNVCRKYAQKKFMKASLFSIGWAKETLGTVSVPREEGRSHTPLP